MKKIFILVLLTAALFAVSWEKAKVVYVIDGDTVVLKQGKDTFKARLIALDTFETKVNHRAFIQLETIKNINRRNKGTIKQVLHYGFKAKKYVEKKVLNKNVEFISFGIDQYGRSLVWLEGVNYLLIRKGLAVYYPNNLLPKRVKSFLLKASREANKEKRGIYELR